MSPALLSLPYLPSVQWLAIAAGQKTIYIEQQENFVKGTSRNRAQIATAQGKQTLSIPLAGGRDHHQGYKLTQTSAPDNWQKKHLHSLQAAYAGAPYYEHYLHRLLPFYTSPQPFLFEFNLQLLRELLRLLKMEREIILSSQYEIAPCGWIDYRNEKRWMAGAEFPRYYQIFEDRHGFLPNLCALDILFHLGPQAKDYICQLNE